MDNKYELDGGWRWSRGRKMEMAETRDGQFVFNDHEDENEDENADLDNSYQSQTPRRGSHNTPSDYPERERGRVKL